MIILFSSSSFLLFRYLYEKNAGIYFDNVKNSTVGAFHLVSFGGIRYLFMGFAHLFISDDYGNKM